MFTTLFISYSELYFKYLYTHKTVDVMNAKKCSNFNHFPQAKINLCLY